MPHFMIVLILYNKQPGHTLLLHFFRSGLWAWWAKLAYQVMLTIRGRLITPFILGSMSAGLNILIRHSFTDLCIWIMAWVPWPQLLFTTRLVSLPGGRSVRPRGHRQSSIINMVTYINSDKIVAETSPTTKRSRFTKVSSATSQHVHKFPADSKGTGSAAQTGAPRILLKNVHKMTYLQSDDKSLWYRDGDVYKQIKNCSVKLRNIWNLMTVGYTAV